MKKSILSGLVISSILLLGACGDEGNGSEAGWQRTIPAIHI